MADAGRLHPVRQKSPHHLEPDVRAKPGGILEAGQLIEQPFDFLNFRLLCFIRLKKTVQGRFEQRPPGPQWLAPVQVAGQFEGSVQEVQEFPEGLCLTILKPRAVGSNFFSFNFSFLADRQYQD